ncbi:MAG: LPS translocon maturation chaperone LptM [Silanimonas lenta]|jgi:predicted small lipoprotein YifL
MKRPCLALVLIAATLLLAACGNKGDLVRPSPKAEAALA